MVNSESSLPEANMVIGEERIDDGIYSTQQEVFHQFVGGTKKRDWSIALWDVSFSPGLRRPMILARCHILGILLFW